MKNYFCFVSKLDKNKALEVLESWENLMLFMVEIEKNPATFPILMEIALDDEHKNSWRAAWMADKIHEKNPNVILPFIESIIEKLKGKLSQGTKRHFLKLLSLHHIPEKHFGFLVDYCFEMLTSKEPPAIRVHAMQVLYNISEKETDLKPEVLAVIEHEMEYHATAGIKSRGSKLAKKLSQQLQKK